MLSLCVCRLRCAILLSLQQLQSTLLLTVAVAAGVVASEASIADRQLLLVVEVRIIRCQERILLHWQSADAAAIELSAVCMLLLLLMLSAEQKRLLWLLCLCLFAGVCVSQR